MGNVGNEDEGAEGGLRAVVSDRTSASQYFRSLRTQTPNIWSKLPLDPTINLGRSYLLYGKFHLYPRGEVGDVRSNGSLR